jgi:small-conductance mechanosensitive channel
MVGVAERIRDVISAETAFTLAVAVLVVGIVVAYLVWRLTHTLFRRTGLSDAVEGTTVERGANRFGTSTAGVVGLLFAVSVYAIAILFAFNIARVFDLSVFWAQVAALLPQLLVATFAVIIGFIFGDKAELIVQERLRSVKVPEASVIPKLVKYSIYYIAALIALSQVGVAITALLVLLAAYVFGLVLLAAVAFKDLLAAGAAGIYLLLNEPYTIGDEIRVDDRRGIVQEITMFVTHVEADGEEYIVPNHQVFRSGIVRVRE